jgi:hypothetical protein
VRPRRILGVAVLALVTGCSSMPAGGPATGAGAPAHRLPAAQLVEHLLAVADREWRDWGQTTVDATDGHSRVERRGAVETDTAWLPPPAQCDPPRRLRRIDGCHHAQPFDAVARLRRYWVAGLGPGSRPALDPVELERVVREEPWSPSSFRT